VSGGGPAPSPSTTRLRLLIGNCKINSVRGVGGEGGGVLSPYSPGECFTNGIVGKFRVYVYVTGHGSEKFIHLFYFIIISLLFKYECFFHFILILSRRW
jgi:hypothetical protein